jgi:hypothetical protein
MKCFLIEEYPTADRLEVEKIPLPLWHPLKNIFI